MKKTRKPAGGRRDALEAVAAGEAPEQAPANGDFPVVGIGASAGGLEAFSALLKNLAADTGMAFVIVQHLDPTHGTMLAELLSRSTKMPVEEVREGSRVAPNRVYVIPANADMVIRQGVLSLLTRSTSRGQHMPIDTFLRSLAKDLRDLGIGVILSGTNSDGALGIEAVKSEGGITFAQDEKSAKFDGMPRAAVSTKCVDFVLPPEEIAKELGRIADHPYVRTRHGAKESGDGEPGAFSLSRIFALLRASTGVDFTLYKHSTIRRRISRRMALHKINDLDGYVQFLEKNPTELESLYREILIKVTAFFRDPEMFEALKTKVLPEIVRAVPLDTPIRVWTPGCATGEEAYSIAIVILEYLSERNLNHSIQIFATDISEEAIEKARAGTYFENISIDVSPERLRRFFVKHDVGYQVSKTARDLCVFARQNVAKDPPFSKLDLISCRNLLIYMEPALQKRIIPMYHYALKPKGFLLLGTSETVGDFSDMFELVDKRNKIYAKRQISGIQRFEFEPGAYFSGHLEGGRVVRPAEEPGPDLQKEADRLVLANFGPAGVVVNDEFDVVHFRGRTSPFIEPAPGKASLNLLKMAREGLFLDLRNALQRAKRSGQAFKKKNIPTKLENGFHGVDLDVIPLSPSVHGRHFLVLFQEHVEPAGVPKGKLSKADERQADQLKQELVAARQYLQSIIEEQEATNEELQSANEEILSSNEELQSINEEMETAKEELQSTNEELTTVNEELQNRNVDLSQINDDLHNLLSSVNIAIVMLGRDLRIRRFTPTAGRILNIIPADVGRPITDLRPNIQIPDLQAMISEVLDSVTAKERELYDDDGRPYSMYIRPYRTSDNRIDGAVLVLVDVETIRRGFDQNRGQRELLQGAVEMSFNPLAVVDGNFSFRFANAAFQQIAGPRVLDGLPISETRFAALAPLLEQAVREGVPGRKVMELPGPDGPFQAEVRTRVFRILGAPEVIVVGIQPQS